MLGTGLAAVAGTVDAGREVPVFGLWSLRLTTNLAIQLTAFVGEVVHRCTMLLISRAEEFGRGLLNALDDGAVLKERVQLELDLRDGSAGCVGLSGEICSVKTPAELATAFSEGMIDIGGYGSELGSLLVSRFALAVPDRHDADVDGARVGDATLEVLGRCHLGALRQEYVDELCGEPLGCARVELVPREQSAEPEQPSRVALLAQLVDLDGWECLRCSECGLDARVAFEGDEVLAALHTRRKADLGIGFGQVLDDSFEGLLVVVR